MRNDRIVFYTKAASLITGTIGAAIGMIGVKLMVDSFPYFTISKSLQDSINQLLWIEGEVESDKGFESVTMEDGSKAVYSEMTKKNSHNYALERIVEQKIRKENFNLLVGKDKVRVFNNAVNDCEMVYEDVQQLNKGSFEWLKSIFSIAFMFMLSPPFTQDNLTKTSESAILLNRIYCVFGRLMKNDSGYSVLPSVITKNKQQFLNKTTRQVLACFLVSGITLAVSYLLHKIHKKMLRTEQYAKASKNMVCVICQTNKVEFILLPCNHFCTCEPCHVDFCPVCNIEINRKLRVFY